MPCDVKGTALQSLMMLLHLILRVRQLRSIVLWRLSWFLLPNSRAAFATVTKILVPDGMYGE